ncbi:hypothetical protein NIES2135_61360 (plasmid) [Leptolyngbya boryana NIES-2135]|jgi:hypothetical protein|uniref:Uncharacterized protein n=1 Tax=Leptolyngbya boryana NIES-2135 TaxID=1973484 RepID=A0A1Z4JRB9_LEPBY|nr:MULTISPECIES: hypothetical protein [Leptolyngbya]BAY59259.1 hypothetical protein NIES2135_61360 [Leptolyngbya boryana NIES-2135]MBD2372848.1 hypothetical protein [Leptolyngbya sp. FACHB-238]MBD2397399.1 hypothetical protein [Leptolyngbya sp. FACHB-239]MBD2403796.1 hypothetical protein [Leptolyngbya sp. FACHB-402]ULP33452.1 hypothetical protein MCP04_30450 [Leptolyngbya boryana IU 594]
MLHTHRVWHIKTVPTLEELVKALLKKNYVLCAGFRVGDLLFLNDSTSEDAIQEYAIVLNVDQAFTQVESVTVDWCSPEELHRIIGDIQAGDYALVASIAIRVDESDSHRCESCA